MAFLYGFLGALALIVLLLGGGIAGWCAHKWYVRHTKPTAQEPGAQERQRLIEQQQAFQQLQNYSTERAYGMAGGES